MARKTVKKKCEKCKGMFNQLYRGEDGKYRCWFCHRKKYKGTPRGTLGGYKKKWKPSKKN